MVVKGLTLLALSCLAACGREPAATGGATVIRLIDALQDDTLQRPFDPADPQVIVDTSSERLLQLGAAELANEEASWAEGEELRALLPGRPSATGHHELTDASATRRLVMQGPILLTRTLAVTNTKPLLVRIEAKGGAKMGLIPVSQGQAPLDLSPVSLLHELSQSTGILFVRMPDPGSDWLQAVVPADSQRLGLVVVVVSQGAATTIDRLELRTLTRLAADLLDPRLRPTTEHIQLDGEAREAFVLPDGGSGRWTLALPDSASRLTVDLATLGLAAQATLVYQLRQGDSDVVEGRLPVPRPGAGAAPNRGQDSESTAGGPWHRAVVELPGAAGKPTTLTLLADIKGGAIVVGRPTISSRPTARQSTRPDVIIVSLDTFRADRIAPGVAATPRLQALAEASLKFTDASSTSAWTLPAHTSLFTGRWSQAHGVTNRYRKLLAGASGTLAQAFHDAGYETTAITGGGYVSPTFGLAAGFERYDIHDPCLFAIDRKTKAVIQPHGSRQSLLSLLGGERDRPLFAFVHTFAAHHGLPVDAKLERIGMENEDFRRIRTEIFRLLAAQKTSDAPTTVEPQLIEDVNAVYDASIMAADDLVGDIVDTLIAAGRWENTILVVTSDHGQELFERDTVGHGHQMHPELLRIPLLVRAPGARQGLDDSPVSLVDLAPTVRELAGLPPDQRTHGRSLASLLHGGTLRPAPMLSHLANSEQPPTHVYRRGPLTLHLTEDSDGLPRPTALYDLADDPGERHDLLDARRAVADELAAEFALVLPLLRAGAGGNADDVTLDDDTRRQLEALGYVTGS